MRKYLKKDEKTAIVKKFCKGLGSFALRVSFLSKFILCTLIFTGLIGAILWGMDVVESSVALEQGFEYKGNTSIAALTTPKRTVISVPSGMVKAHPFLPYRNLDGDFSELDIPDFELVQPPEAVASDSTAARVMDTIVSGILYDKYSPSAILNIEGNDYLVKKGDVVNGYNVINIMKDSVTVKLGTNVYRAGIGEILTEGEMNYNEVSNLSNKFGGVREWVIII